MVLCEQFVFTSSKLGDGGYQVTSKSSGITPKILDELEEYLYPIGIEPSNFVESKSMRVLQDKIAFIQSKNIGTGFDGRSDTMYSHIIIINKDDFKKFENDSRIFNKYYSEIKKSGHLTPLSIEHTKLNPDFTCIDVIGIIQFEECMRSIFKNKKVAIIGVENQKLIQSLLSLIPPSLRSISFSTLTPQPEIQTKFEIIQTSEQKKSILGKYVIIDASKKKKMHIKDRTMFDNCLNYLIEIIDKKKSEEVTAIYDEFERIPTSDTEDKILLTIGTLLLNSKKIYLNKQIMVNKILTIIEKLPSLYFQKYLNQLKVFLTVEEYEQYALKFEIENIINEYNPKKITLEILISMFYSLTNNNLETRQKLLNELVKKNSEMFVIDGVQLIFDSRYSMYHKEIMQVFIKNEMLNLVVMKIFLEENSLTHIQKQSLYEEFIENSLPINVRLVAKLLMTSIFDFKKTYETKYFRSLLENVCDNSFFIKTSDVESILEMTENIFKKIKDIIEFKTKLDTNGITEENLKQLIMIVKTLQTCLNNIYEKSNTAEFQKKIRNLMEQLEIFILDNPMPSREKKHWKSRD